MRHPGERLEIGLFANGSLVRPVEETWAGAWGGYYKVLWAS